MIWGGGAGRRKCKEGILIKTVLLALASAVCTGVTSHTENHILDSAKKASYIPCRVEESFAKLAQAEAIPPVHIFGMEPNMNGRLCILVYWRGYLCSGVRHSAPF
jgi:hypothetical protein